MKKNLIDHLNFIHTANRVNLSAFLSAESSFREFWCSPSISFFRYHIISFVYIIVHKISFQIFYLTLSDKWLLLVSLKPFTICEKHFSSFHHFSDESNFYRVFLLCKLQSVFSLFLIRFSFYFREFGSIHSFIIIYICAFNCLEFISACPANINMDYQPSLSPHRKFALNLLLFKC